MASDGNQTIVFTIFMQSFNPLIGLLWLLTYRIFPSHWLRIGFNPLIGLLWLLTECLQRHGVSINYVSIP